MRKHKTKLLTLVGLLIGMLLLLSVSALASEADPISRSIEITPKALTSSGTVRVSINIVNTSDDETVSVTLVDPAGNVCTGFGSGGTANLSPGVSQPYTGSWTVTQAQLEAGKVIYTAKYAVTNENGEKVQVTRPIAANITHNTAVAKLNVERYVDPGYKVMQGQTVTIRYTIKNVGTIDVKNIKITDPDIIDTPVEKATLAVDETAELKYTFMAGSASKTTKAEISYEYEVNGKTEKPKAIQATPQTIDVTIPDLVVQLTGKMIANKGDKVDLTYIITNKSELSYEQLRITDTLLGDIDSGLSLGPDKSLQGTKSITVSEGATYQFTVTGVDSTGNNVMFLSNQHTIQLADAAVEQTSGGVVPVVLNIVVEADRDVIYVEPSLVNFHIKVSNNGAQAVENVIIAAIGNIEGRSTPIKEIDIIQPGETKDLFVEVNASMGGKFQFSATAKDSQGADMTIESNVFPIAFHQLATPPTPSPSPTPVVTEPPETEPPAETQLPFTPPEQESGGIGSILLTVLGILLVVIVVAVGVLFFLDNRRKGGGGGGGKRPGGGRATVKVIDTIERSPHRDYMRAPKRGNGNTPASTAAPAPAAPKQDTGATPVVAPTSREAFDGEYDPYDVPMDEVIKAQREMQEEEMSVSTPGVEAEAADFDATLVYQRPKDMPRESAIGAFDDEDEPRPAARPEAAAKAEAPAESTPLTEDTAVYRGDYLSRIRSARTSDTSTTEETAAADTAEEPGSTLSDEEAALLSGSTGQYRLSRKSGSVPGREQQPVVRRVAEDPEDFARKQRASKLRSSTDTDFYNDDDDDEPSDTSRRRRR